jgi:hypothetical protein
MIEVKTRVDRAGVGDVGWAGEIEVGNGDKREEDKEGVGKS